MDFISAVSSVASSLSDSDGQNSSFCVSVCKIQHIQCSSTYSLLLVQQSIYTIVNFKIHNWPSFEHVNVLVIVHVQMKSHMLMHLIHFPAHSCIRVCHILTSTSSCPSSELSSFISLVPAVFAKLVGTVLAIIYNTALILKFIYIFVQKAM